LSLRVYRAKAAGRNGPRSTTACLIATLSASAPSRAADARVSIDVACKRAPISKYVYGQFIEHLGRCIYGGLWAEMLEDRKFFYPVTGEAPAWETFVPGPRSWDDEGHPYELLMPRPGSTFR
jgi:hypothetical protein